MPRPLLYLLACLVTTVCHGAESGSRPNKPVNMVLITIDTLRPDHLGCYGYRQIHTPNIDALAASGSRFEHAYTPVPITLPSHSVMMTGTYPMYNGMHDFSGNRLNPQQPTLASLLKEHGYSTGAVIGSAVLDSRFGLNRGFDFYYDHFDFSRLEDANLDLMKRPGNAVVDVALDWLADNMRKPFFLWVHLYDPHIPYTVPAPYDGEYKDRPYDGEIAFADSQVGRLTEFLKRNKLFERALIVLSGDHGESLGEHGEKAHGFFIYDSTLRVPLIVKLPSGQHQQETVSANVSLVDLMPTAMEALNLPVPAIVQGTSLLARIKGARETGNKELYAESFLPLLHFDWSELRSIQSGTYHFIDAPKPELYDLSKDPGELHNVFGEKPGVAGELKGHLAAFVARYTAGQQQSQAVPLDPVLLERLKSLGYAGFSGGGAGTVGNPKLPDPKDRIGMYEIVADAIDDGQHGRYGQSNEKLKRALAIQESCVPVHYLLGLNYYRSQNYPKSVDEFRRVLELSPNFNLVYFYLGMAYGRAGNLHSAIMYLNKALQADPTNFSAAFNLGSAYLQAGSVDQALATFRKSVEISPEYAQGHRAIGEVLLYQGNVDEALTELHKAAQLAPDDPSVHTSLAAALKAKGLQAEAAQEMQKAAPATPPQR